MSDSAAMREDVYRQPVDATRLGVVVKPLSAWERVYNITIVRKLVILVALAAAWEIYARWLNDPLLFAGLLTVIVIGLLVENVIFRSVEARTVRRWGMQS